MDNKFKKQRKEVAQFMRRLYSLGLTTTSGGNISLRVSDDIIVITPSAIVHAHPVQVIKLA